MAPTSVTLKLLVDTRSKVVLFAEAEKDFVDFLFNILSLAVGTVVGLLTKQQDMPGALGNLYDSIENLSDTYIQPTAKKDTLLKPIVSNTTVNVPLLLPDIQSSTPTPVYRCGSNYSTSCRGYVANEPKSICPCCSSVMSQTATFVKPPTKQASSSDEGGYVKGVITYMIMDDLVVRPMSTISCISLLNKFKIKDVGVLEEVVVAMGTDEGLKLLKASLLSKTVLTDVFLEKKASQSDVNNSDGGHSIMI